jgi:hypothetical protein
MSRAGNAVMECPPWGGSLTAANAGAATDMTEVTMTSVIKTPSERILAGV